MSDMDVMSFRVKADVELEKSSLKEASSALDAFYNKYQNKSMKIDTKDMVSTARKGINEVQKLYKQGMKEMADFNAGKTDNPSWWSFEEGLEDSFNNTRLKMNDFFGEMRVLFNDGSIATGFEEMMEKLDSNFSMVVVDLGERVKYLKTEIADALQDLKQTGAAKNMFGRMFFTQGDMTEDELEKHIELLNKLSSYQKELEVFNNKNFELGNAPLGNTTSSVDAQINILKSNLQDLQQYNNQVEAQYKLTTQQLSKRESILTDINNDTWDQESQDYTKSQIDDKEYYERKVEDLQDYIKQKRTTLEELKNLQSELFRIDDVDGLVNKANTDIARYEGWLQELKNPKPQQNLGDNLGLEGVVKQLSEIKEAINEVRAAFEPLTMALSSEGSLLNKMVSATVEDLDRLEQKFKQFNDVITTDKVKTGGIDEGATNDEQKAIVNAQKILSDIQTLGANITGELNVIRTKIEETFNFATIEPNISNITSITDKIYEQFKELQGKINKLEFNIQAPKLQGTDKTEADIVDDAGEAIEDEGRAAEVATPAKDAFTAANRRLADSMEKTGEAGKVAAAGINAEAQALEGYDKVATTTDRDGKPLFQTLVSSTKGSDSVDTTTQRYSYNEDEKKWDLDAETLVQDYKAFAKLEAQAEKKKEKATAMLKKFMSNFDNKAAGRWTDGKQDGNYNFLKGVLQDGIGSVEEIDEVVNRMQLLDAEYSKVMQSFRKGTKSMNPFVNAFNTIDEMSGRVRQAELDFGNLKFPTDGLVAQVKELPKLLEALETALKPNNDGIVEIEKVADAYGNLNAALRSVNTAMGTQRKEDSVITKQMTQSEKNYNQALQLQEKMYDIKKKLVGVDEESSSGKALNRELQAAKKEFNLTKKTLDAKQKEQLTSNKTQLENELRTKKKEYAAAQDAKNYEKALGLQEKIYNIKKQLIGLDEKSAKAQSLNQDLAVLEEEYNASFQTLKAKQQKQLKVDRDNLESIYKTQQKEYDDAQNTKQYNEALSLQEKIYNIKKKLVGVDKESSDGKALNRELQSLQRKYNLTEKLLDTTQKQQLANNKAKFNDELQTKKNEYKENQNTKSSEENIKSYNKALQLQEKMYNIKKQLIGLDEKSGKSQKLNKDLSAIETEYNLTLQAVKTKQRKQLINNMAELESSLRTQKGEKDEATRIENLVSLYKEYTDARLRHKNLSSDTSGKGHSNELSTAIQDVIKTKQALMDLGVNVNDIAKSELLTTAEINALLEEQIKYKKDMQKIKDQAADKAIDKANKEAEKAQTQQEKNYQRVLQLQEKIYETRKQLIGVDENSANGQKLNRELTALREEYNLRRKLLSTTQEQEVIARKQNLKVELDTQRYEKALDLQERIYNIKQRLIGVDKESAKGQSLDRNLSQLEEEYKLTEKLLNAQQKKKLLGNKNTLEGEYQTAQKEQNEANSVKYLLDLYKQYTDAELKAKKLQSDTSGKDHSSELATVTNNIVKAKQALADLGIDVDNIAASQVMTETEINALLAERIKYQKQIKQIEDQAADKATNKANKENQSYGKTQFNRENRYKGIIDSYKRNLSDTGFSDEFTKQLDDYEKAFKKYENIKKAIESGVKSVGGVNLKEQFSDTTLDIEKMRKGLLEVFKAYDKFSNIPRDSIIDEKTLNADELKNAKAAMLAFANAVTNGRFSLEGFNSAGTTMYGVLDRGSGAAKEITVVLSTLTGQMKAIEGSVNKVSSSWGILGGEFKQGFKQIVGQYIGFHEALQAFRTGVNYVKEIDLAMTELKKVTDATDATYSNFLKTASVEASKIGSTISEFTTATSNFARLGYTIDESTNMAKTAIVYKNVADGLDTIDESTDSIISTMMAFGIEADSTMSIIDKFNAVGNQFAITSAGIGDALQRSASALFAAGNDIDESIALITTANSVIQNPEQVGKCLPTIK